MNEDFTTIFELCKAVLENAHQAKPTLVRACLETLNAFLSWIPMYYVIYSDMIDKLVLMFQSDYLRNFSLACLVEIASLPIDPKDEAQKNKYLFMLQRVTEELNKLISVENEEEKIQAILTSVKKKNRNIFEVLARGIANFYSEFFKSQHSWLEAAVAGNDQAIRVCHHGFRYLLMMMKVEEEQVFKITIDFFHFYIAHVLEANSRGETSFGGLSYGSKGPSLDQIYQ
jgi:exportin-1